MRPCSVSFVIPYYRIDRMLLKRCLDSLFSQPGLEEPEVILVDDGTPDTPVPGWLSEWQLSERVRYVYQENKGLGGARNTGMILATREYLHFVDPDDYLIADAYATVLRLLAEKDPDLLFFSFRKVYDDRMETALPFKGGIRFEGTGTDYMTHYNLRAGACGYLFRRTLLQDLIFPEHTLHEDEAFTPLLCLRAARLVDTDIPAYAYYQRADSIMNSREEVRLHRRFTDLLGIQSGLQSRLSTLPLPARKALRRRIDQNYMSMLYKLLTDSPDRRFLLSYLKQVRKQGGYPLPLHAYTQAYLLFALVTACPGMPVLLRGLLDVVRKIRKEPCP